MNNKLTITLNTALSVLAVGCGTTPQSIQSTHSEQSAESKLTTGNVVRPTKKPNILWVVTDDQRADSIGAFNQATRGSKKSALGFVLSPNIDKLAKEGTLFTHAYNNSPACAPSRASMVTGLYPHHSGRLGFEQTHNLHDVAGKTIPQVLSSNGYQTAVIGKSGYRIYAFEDKPTWKSLNFYDTEISYKNDLNKSGLTDVYKESQFVKGEKPSRRELFYFPNGRVEQHYLERNGKAVNEPNPVEKELQLLRSHTRKNQDLIIGGVSPQPAGETLDGNTLKAFNAYLKNTNKRYKTPFKRTIQGPNSNKPLMVSLGFNFPHTPVLPPQSFRDKFKGKTYTVPEFSKDEITKLPPQLRKLYATMKIDGLSDEEMQQAISDYYAFCAYGDSLIGEAIDNFKKYSQDNGQDWLILVTVGDHGWQLGEQGIEAKFSPWNTSNQGVIVAASSTPMEFPKGKVYSDFVEYVDIAPTLFGAALIKDDQIKTPLDGFDLAEIITTPALTRDYVIGEMNHVIGPRSYLRSERFAFSMRHRKENGKPGQGFNPGENIKWAYSASDKQVEMALYDLKCDPNERNNIAYTPEYKGVSHALRRKLSDIVLGDARVEVNWKKLNDYTISDFALGANNQDLSFLKAIVNKLPSCS